MSKVISIWHKIYRKILSPLLKIVVNCRPLYLQTNIYKQLASGSVLYVLPYKSQVDLLILKQISIQFNIPDPLQLENIAGYQLPRYIFINQGMHCIVELDLLSIQVLQKYLKLHRERQISTTRIVLVSLLWGREPNYLTSLAEKKTHVCLRYLQKFYRVIFYGRDTFIYFSELSFIDRIALGNNNDIKIIQILAKMAWKHLSKVYRMASGPKIISHNHLLNLFASNKLLINNTDDNLDNNPLHLEQTRKKINIFLDEIASKFSYNTIRLADNIFSYLWRYLYYDITVCGIEKIRRLSFSGEILIYLPCHRSHIDYLLLSYILYYHGLVPPHIAAGVNLNFWPVGTLLRRMGAFFIRRSLKGNKLYSKVLKKYLTILLTNGFSIEFFIEGARSRTGNLLMPKTGILTMIVQTALQNPAHSITLVPVYIGYEHVIEDKTYADELNGIAKQPESFKQILYTITKLHKFGNSYVNFGAPIKLKNDLKIYINDTGLLNVPPADWLQSYTHQLAHKVMVNINGAVAINSVNLIISIILATVEKKISRKSLVNYLTSYVALLNEFCYSKYYTIPITNIDDSIEHAITIKKVHSCHDLNLEEIIFIQPNDEQALLYYHRNISHITVLPSIIANLLLRYSILNYIDIKKIVTILYPLLQNDLFLPKSKQWLVASLHNILNSLISQKIIYDHQSFYKINLHKMEILQSLAYHCHDLIIYYTIVSRLLIKYPKITQQALQKKSYELVEESSLNSIYKNRTLYWFLKINLTCIMTLKNMNINQINSVLKKVLPNNITESI